MPKKRVAILQSEKSFIIQLAFAGKEPRKPYQQVLSGKSISRITGYPYHRVMSILRPYSSDGRSEEAIENKIKEIQKSEAVEEIECNHSKLKDMAEIFKKFQIYGAI